jgi:hypothetical protein
MGKRTSDLSDQERMAQITSPNRLDKHFMRYPELASRVKLAVDSRVVKAIENTTGDQFIYEFLREGIVEQIVTGICLHDWRYAESRGRLSYEDAVRALHDERFEAAIQEDVDTVLRVAVRCHIDRDYGALAKALVRGTGTK